MNAQIVLCPGINDGAALIKTLSDLQMLGDALISVSVVPVGITKHRAGLAELRPVTKSDALRALEAASRFDNVWCSDEMYLRAGLPIPPAEFYKDFSQLENGVGMLALFKDEWEEASEEADLNREAVPNGNPAVPAIRRTVATGRAAAPMLSELLRDFSHVTVIAVENSFYGDTVDVAGLLTGGDLLRGLKGRELGGRVLIPTSMLQHGEDVFLDDMTVGELSEALGVPVIPVLPSADMLRKELSV